MSNAIEWEVKDPGDDRSYGVVTCQGPYLGMHVKGTIVTSDDGGGARAIFQISLFSLSSGGWVPFVDSCRGFRDAEDIFERLSRRSHELMKTDQAIPNFLKSV